jgi:hypothetical protein
VSFVSDEPNLVLEPPGPRGFGFPRRDDASIEATSKLSGALGAPFRLFVEAGEHQRFELGRNRDAAGRERLGRLVQMLNADFDHRFAVEHVDPRQEVLGDGAEGINVGARVGRAWLDDRLRGHVLRRADERADTGELRFAVNCQLLDHAKIE